MPSPTGIIIAGPKGAEKTTFATEFLPKLSNCRRFINADLLAQGLSPSTPSKKPSEPVALCSN